MNTKLNPKITSQEMCEIYQQARKDGFVSEENNSVIFFDLTRLRNRLEHLKSVFPSNVKHTVAIKTSPLVEAMKVIVESGVGLEAASFTEVELARAAGAEGEQI